MTGGHIQRPCSLSQLRQSWRSTPKSHWVATRLASEYMALGRLDLANKWSATVFAIMPECPLVLWDRACVLEASKAVPNSIDTWQSIIAAASTNRSCEYCWESKHWANRLVTDCYFRIGVAYQSLDNPEYGHKYLGMFVRRYKSTGSRYSVIEGKLRLQLTGAQIAVWVCRGKLVQYLRKSEPPNFIKEP